MVILKATNVLFLTITDLVVEQLAEVVDRGMKQEFKFEKVSMKDLVGIITSVIFVLFFPVLVFAQTSHRGVAVGPFLSSTDAQEIAGWGANIIRYSLSQDPRAHTETEAEYYARLVDSLTYLDNLIPTLASSGMQVIIDPGLGPGGYLFEKNKRKDRIFHEAWAQNAFVAGWQTIAAHYAGNPTVLGYQLLNEPATGKKVTKKLKKWKALATYTAQTIRAIDADPGHIIYVSSEYGNPNNLSKVKNIPVAGIGYTFNYYEPQKYTHQGIGSNPYGVSYPYKKANLKTHRKILKKVASFKKKVRGAPILIGELSVIRWAPNASAYLSDVLSLCEEYGFDYTIYGYDANVWDLRYTSDMYNYSPSPTPTDRLLTAEQYFLLNN